MEEQVVNAVSEYFKHIDVEISKLPIRVEFEDSTEIQIEAKKESLVFIFTTAIKIEDLKDIANKLLLSCYFKNQKGPILKIGVHSTDKICFICVVDFDKVTVPLITEIIDVLIDVQGKVL